MTPPSLPIHPAVIVLGAGELGLSLLTALAEHPSQPRLSVLLRPSSSSTSSREALLKQLSSLSTTPVYDDLLSPTLHSTLSGYDIVISASGFSSPPGTQLAILEAVLKGKVGWYVPWQFGVDYDVIGSGSGLELFDEQLEVRNRLRAQKEVRWTIVSTGLFTSYLFDPTFGVVDFPNNRLTALGSFSNRVTITSPDDIGRLTTSILLDPDLDANINDQQSDADLNRRDGVIYTAGQTISYQDLYDALSAIGWKMDKREITVEMLEKRQKEDPEDKFAKYQMVFGRGRGVSWDEGVSWNAKRRMDVEGLREYVERCVQRP